MNSMDLDFAGRRELIETIEAQRFYLAEMTGRVEPSDLQPGARLTSTEMRIMSALSTQRGKIVTEEGLLAAAYFDRPDCDWPELKIMAVWICKLRRKITVPIRSVYGVGYVIDKPADPLGHLSDWQRRADEEGCGALIKAIGDVA